MPTPTEVLNKEDWLLTQQQQTKPKSDPQGGCSFAFFSFLMLLWPLSLGSGAEVGRRIGGHSWICSVLAGVRMRRAVRSHTSLSAFPLVLQAMWKRSLLFFLPPCWFFLPVVVQYSRTFYPIQSLPRRPTKSSRSGTSSIWFSFRMLAFYFFTFLCCNNIVLLWLSLLLILIFLQHVSFLCRRHDKACFVSFRWDIKTFFLIKNYDC